MSDTSNKVLIFTFFCYFLNSVSSNYTSTPADEDTSNDESESCILPKALCGYEATIKNVLESGPNLKDVISKLNETDFLEKYRAGENNEDKNLSITQLIAKYGYKFQTYTIETEDGYELTMHRILGDGDPVLLVHGILNSAIDWFTIGKENALPYLLADQGYDVWLFNARGTIEESQRNVSLCIEKDAEQYWDFSWDEIGRYDLPATIDLVLNETGKPTLRYVGHSQGTTTFYVMGSERPEYAKKVSLMVTLSPIVWMSNMTSTLIQLLSHNVNELSVIIRNVLGIQKVDSKFPLIELVTDYICGTSEVATIICGTLIFLVGGFDYENVNATQMPVIFAHTPSTASTKQLVHYGQSVNSGKFRRYDYGTIANLVKYGTAQPPDYNVENISTPVALFYRKSGDWLSAYEDVLILKSKLPNVVDFYEVPQDNWNHFDYVWAKDVKEMVYNRILDLFKEY